MAAKEDKLGWERKTEYGNAAVVGELTAVISVGDAINEPRYPSLKGIMGAKRKPQEQLSASDLGLSADDAGEPGSRTVVLCLSEPPPRAESRTIEDDGSAAEQIVAYLEEKRLL